MSGSTKKCFCKKINKVKILTIDEDPAQAGPVLSFQVDNFDPADPKSEDPLIQN